MDYLQRTFFERRQFINVFSMGGTGGALVLALLGASDLGHKVEICGDSGVQT